MLRWNALNISLLASYQWIQLAIRENTLVNLNKYSLLRWNSSNISPGPISEIKSHLIEECSGDIEECSDDRTSSSLHLLCVPPSLLVKLKIKIGHLCLNLYLFTMMTIREETKLS